MAISKVVYKSSANATPVTWIDATGATAAAADIISPKTAMLKDGVVTQGTGSAGVANVVQGTFTGASTGAAATINMSYTGSGYPIAGIVYPVNGVKKTNDAFATLAQKYIIGTFSFAKWDVTTTPNFSTTNADENRYFTMVIYKYSDSDATSYTDTKAFDTAVCSQYSAGSTANTAVRFNSATQMSVYIASNSYGFKSGIEYAYKIIYSS